MEREILKKAVFFASENPQDMGLFSGKRRSIPLIYYAESWKSAGVGYRHRDQVDPDLDERVIQVTALAKAYRHSYGSRRMAQTLQEEGYAIGQYATRTSMKQAGVICQQQRRVQLTTPPNPKWPVAENTLNRQFAMLAPDQVWVPEFTYLWTQERLVIYCRLMDCYSRRIVGWAHLTIGEARSYHRRSP